MLKKLVLGLTAILSSLTACNTDSVYKNVSVADLKAASEPNRMILDVRQPEEFAQGHVQGAKLIPLGQLEANLARVPDNAPVYVICRSGSRSMRASDILVKNGKTDVRNVKGGTLAWQAAGYPVAR